MLRPFTLLFLIIMCCACEGEPNTKYTEKYPAVEEVIETVASEPDSLLRHVVLFSFTEESTAADIRLVTDAFTALPDKIKEIHSYEWGLNNSPEGLDKGFTHAFFLTFKSEADRDSYLPHPDHKAFGNVLSPFLKDVLVVDYWTK